VLAFNPVVDVVSETLHDHHPNIYVIWTQQKYGDESIIPMTWVMFFSFVGFIFNDAAYIYSIAVFNDTVVAFRYMDVHE